MAEIEHLSTSPYHSSKWRYQLIGLLPFLIFLYRVFQYFYEGTPDWIMANCNVTLVMLSLGMLLGRQLPTRVAAIWLTIGVPMWLIDAWVTQVIWIASIISHFGGWLIGLFALRQTRVTGRSWLPAAGWFFLWQVVTRFTTRPDLNVNIAHSPYEFSTAWFGSYWQFWVVCALVVLTLTWVVERGLLKAFPNNNNQTQPVELRTGETGA
ncbi:MAG: hypothetical protein EBU88_01240 [Acidobacteria bacterium]|nr:hypothetical protein [Acidobacteriota bacterium]